MKIKELYIDGFGHFHHQHIGPFSSPIVVLHGPNEAGKTTILAFIRTILFGFPTRNKEKHYPPLAGGKHGGRMTVIDDAGKEYVIERFVGPRGGPVRIRGESGSPQPEGIFTNMLGNASPDIFTNVFAFSLEELQAGNLLKDSHINGQIYSAGIGAAKLPKALETLKTRRETIFLSSRGRKQVISDLVTELLEVDAKLEDLRGNAAAYGRLVARMESTDEELARMTADHNGLLARRDEQGKLEDAWEDWIDLVDAAERLKAIPHCDRFPTDPFVRLEHAEQRVRTDRGEMQAAWEQLQQAEAAANAIIQDESMLADREELSQINRGRNAFDGSVRDLPERKAELGALEESLVRRLRNLGPDWSEERLESFDLSIAFHDQIEHWRRKLSQSQEHIREVRNEKAKTEQNLAEQREYESDARQSIEASEHPPLTSNQLEELRVALRASRTRHGEYERIRQRHADLRYQLESLSHETVESQNPLERQRLVPQVILAMSGVVFLALGAVLNTKALLLGAVAAAVVFGVAVYLFFKVKHAQPAPSVHISSLQNLVQRAADEEIEAMKRLQEAGHSLAIDLPDAAALDEVEAKIADDEGALRHWDSLNTRFNEITGHVQRQQRRLEEAIQKFTQAEAASHQEHEAWKRWLSDHALPTSFMPETMNELIGLVETTRIECDQVKKMRHRVVAIEVDIQEYHDLVQPLADKHAITVSTDNATHTAIVADMLIERFDKAREEVTQLNTAKEEKEQTRRRYELRENQLKEAEKELQNLLVAVGAENSEVFRFKAEQHAERMELEKKRYERKIRLQRLSGPGETFEHFCGKLKQINKQVISDEIRQLAEQINSIDCQRHEFLKVRGSIDTLIKQLSDEEESSALRVRRNLLLEKLREAAREWSKLRLAEELLNRARKKFEKERQPSVIQHAQRFFTRVTNQRYESLFAPIGEQTITVIDTTGGTKQPAELSRGTREQLYLALRFGLIREFGEHAESLPVVVDEILVNFDLDRAQRAAHAFADLSQTNQVLVFTCHPSMIETFTSAYADAQIIHLSWTP